MVAAFDPGHVPEPLIRKIGLLLRACVTEVEDFVDFIGEPENALRRAARDVSAPALAKIWNNPETTPTLRFDADPLKFGNTYPLHNPFTPAPRPLAHDAQFFGQ
jgi:hypothetical protein